MLIGYDDTIMGMGYSNTMTDVQISMLWCLYTGYAHPITFGLRRFIQNAKNVGYR